MLRRPMSETVSVACFEQVYIILWKIPQNRIKISYAWLKITYIFWYEIEPWIRLWTILDHLNCIPMQSSLKSECNGNNAST